MNVSIDVTSFVQKKNDECNNNRRYTILMSVVTRRVHVFQSCRGEMDEATWGCNVSLLNAGNELLAADSRALNCPDLETSNLAHPLPLPATNFGLLRSRLTSVTHLFFSFLNINFSCLSKLILHSIKKKVKLTASYVIFLVRWLMNGRTIFNIF